MIRIEITENRVSRGSFDFEAPPRIGEKLKIEGRSGWWHVDDVRHLVARDGVAQFKITVSRAEND
jgi:hypothetical protein